MKLARSVLFTTFLLAACQGPPAATNAIGVAECDDYLTKYQTCLDLTAPAEVRVTLKKSLEQTRSSWRAALSTPNGAKNLELVCKQIRESRKRELVPYGCPEM